jgi:hypothetical protein
MASGGSSKQSSGPTSAQKNTYQEMSGNVLPVANQVSQFLQQIMSGDAAQATPIVQAGVGAAKRNAGDVMQGLQQGQAAQGITGPFAQQQQAKTASDTGFNVSQVFAQLLQHFMDAAQGFGAGQGNTVLGNNQQQSKGSSWNFGIGGSGGGGGDSYSALAAL